MVHSGRFDSQFVRHAWAGVLTVALHLGLLFAILYSGGRQDGVDEGDTPITRLVLIASPHADRKAGIEAPPVKPAEARIDPQQPPEIEVTQPPPLPIEQQAALTQREAAMAPAQAIVADLVEPSVTAEPPSDVPEPSLKVVMPQTARAALIQRLTHLAEGLAQTPRMQVVWEQDGLRYQAALVLERARNGIDFDRVMAEVSAEDRGRQLTTLIRLKRVAFSQFTQMIDRWDPTVQLHDDEIIGRFHVNSHFNLLSDRQSMPRFAGKVTTAANGFSKVSTGRRDEDLFPDGFETRAGRIVMPQRLQPFEWAPRNETAQIHEVMNGTRIRFFSDGSYTWSDSSAGTSQYRNEPSAQPVYFIAPRGATVYVQGVVSGKITVYSPQRIVVEGSLTYAHSPRGILGSDDYLGLVCDRYIEVAPSYVTGPGDIDIHAAIYAGRRFSVRDVDHGRPATLRILGSLTAGSVSATEPRYATRIEYDSRFEHNRPPGFPSTSQFAPEDWDGVWSDVTQRSADGAF